MPGPRPPILWKRGLAWLVFLGPFFFLTYGTVNAYTSHRGNVGVFVYGWERSIPFVPWLMLPYMSIDAFYAASLFLYRKRSLLDRHALRLLLATLISCAGFLLFPLRFSFEVPHAEGFNGMLQTILLGFDKPYNQAPSLHIGLLIILWVAYAKKLHGVWRLALHVWFAAIGASVLLVYQHHFIDIWTGALVGIACLYLVPDPPFFWRRTEATPVMLHLACRYAIASVLLAATAILFMLKLSLWYALLLWPASALGLVATAYYGFEKHIFQRHHGVIRLPARLLLAPYLAGAWISYRHYTKADTTPSRINDTIWLGAFPRGKQPLESWHGVLDMTNEFATSPIIASRKKYLPSMDLVPATPTTLVRATRWLDDAQRVGPVLVHCALGLSRSSSVVICWLVWSGQEKDIETACLTLSKLRPRIALTQEHKTNIAHALNKLGKHA